MKQEKNTKELQPQLYIGEDEIRKAAKIFSDYKNAKSKLDKRIIDNEQWFRLRHWEQLREKDKSSVRHSAWLFNSIVNKHADFMDAIPECTILPREERDETQAKTLTEIMPFVLERNNWQNVYSEAAFRKLKTGTAAYSVLWNSNINSGLGDIDIKCVDLLNLFWEPGIKDIQDSRNVFYAELVDNDILIENYPYLNGRLGGNSTDTSTYLYDDAIDISGKTEVIDWYYKKKRGGRTILHYCKFANGILLYSSENDPKFSEKGWYNHGKYPFILDPLYREEGTPAGFGFIDIMKEAQEDIDVLGSEMIRNAKMATKKRYFTRVEGAVNEEEFADLSRDFIHVSGSSLGEESIREITSSPISSVYITILNNKIGELKETSGNRDFTQGGTTGGVTSGTAISALQEAGNKLSRDMIASTYNAFSLVVDLCIELMRQFYSVPRTLRILGSEGEFKFVDFDNSQLSGISQKLGFTEGEYLRQPVFDVSVKAHKQNTFSRQAQNTDALNFFSMGFFDPKRSTEALACLELIDIENKEKLIKTIEENGRLYKNTVQKAEL